MRIKLDAKVRTKDGHSAGHVKRVIWDPKTNEVTAFVIATGGLLGHDVLIGRDVLESATFDGEEIVIDMTKDELGKFEPFTETAHTAPPLGWVAPFPYDYPASAYLMAAEPLLVPTPTPPAGTERPSRAAATCTPPPRTARAPAARPWSCRSRSPRRRTWPTPGHRAQ